MRSTPRVAMSSLVAPKLSLSSFGARTARKEHGTHRLAANASLHRDLAASTIDLSCSRPRTEHHRYRLDGQLSSSNAFITPNFSASPPSTAPVGRAPCRFPVSSQNSRGSTSARERRPRGMESPRRADSGPMSARLPSAYSSEVVGGAPGLNRRPKRRQLALAAEEETPPNINGITLKWECHLTRSTPTIDKLLSPSCCA